MKGVDQFFEALRSGQIGPLKTGLEWEEAGALLGPTKLRIDGVDPLYRYGDVELCVNGETQLLKWMQVDFHEGSARIPSALGLNEIMEIPERTWIIHRLKESEINYETGEFHVPGQMEIRVPESNATLIFFEDDSISSLLIDSNSLEAPQRIR